jgi:hypothetical protein
MFAEVGTGQVARMAAMNSAFLIPILFAKFGGTGLVVAAVFASRPNPA